MILIKRKEVQMKQLNIGLVGYKFMGKAHSNALARLPMFFDLDADIRMKCICGRDEQWVAQSAKKFGWDEYETSWEKLIAREDIDVIDITAPSNTQSFKETESLSSTAA